MQPKSSALALIIAVLAGCGGGGGAEEPAAVSANPAPPSDSPAPTSNPPAATPIAAPAPQSASRAPSPAVQAPAPSQPAVGAPTPNQPVERTVDGETLRWLVTTRLSQLDARNTIARLDSYAGPSQASVVQDWHYSSAAWGMAPGTYTFGSGTAGTPTGDPRVDLAGMNMTITFDPNEPIADIQAKRGLGQFMDLNGAQLSREAPLYFAGSYKVGSTIATWRATPPQAYTAQLVLLDDTLDATAFRVCWNVNRQQIVRLSCARYDAEAKFLGTYVMDDSAGQGPLEWK